MTDKEKLDKLVAEIKKLRKEVKDNIAELGNSESERIGLFKDLEIYDNILSFNDSMQEEPQVKESAKTQHVNETCKENGDSLTQEPVNKDFEMALAEMIDKAQKCVVESWVVAAQWKDELIKLAKSEEPVSGDDENALNSVAITFLQEQQIVPNFYADIIMKAVKRGANWQKEQILDCNTTLQRTFELGKQEMKQQMMAKAIDGTIRPDDGEVWCDLKSFNFKDGDKVKVIVIKED